MRITNTMMNNTMLRNLNGNLGRLDRYQQQMSTGKLFTMPSHDPIGVSKSLTLNTAISELNQYKKNTEDALSWMEITETAVKNVGDILQRIRELAVHADGIKTTEDKEKMKAEIEQLRDQLINTANTTYSGKSIFTGYKTDKKLLDPKTGDYATTSLNQEKMQYEIGINDTLDINVLGHKLFGSIKKKPQYDMENPTDKTAFETYQKNLENVQGSTKGEVDSLAPDATTKEVYGSHLLEVVSQLSKALEAGNQDEIDNALGRLDKHHENVLKVRAEVGAKVNRLELSLNRIEDDTLNFTKLLSQNEDADYAETVMKFKNDESIYRASLSIGARIIQPTLIDFIR